MNATEAAIELQKGCKLAEFCPLIAQTVVTKNKFPVNTAPLTQINFSLNPNLSKFEKEQLKEVLHEFEIVFSDKIGQTNIVQHRIDTGNNPPIR